MNLILYIEMSHVSDVIHKSIVCPKLLTADYYTHIVGR
jgi:hypothetical protein